MHSLIWLAGNLDFFDLKRKLLADSDFARRMIEYLDCVISESIELPDGGPEISRPSTRDFEDDAAYENALRKYGNAVASKRQIHSRSHNSTCFKNKTRKHECRLGFPRPTVQKSIIDDLGVAHLRRDSEWVTPYNPCIATAIGSNQDLSFMGTKAKALELVYYNTNCATKDEASTYQMVMAAALIRKILDEQDPPSISAEERHRLQKFPLRVVNRMANDRGQWSPDGSLPLTVTCMLYPKNGRN